MIPMAHARCAERRGRFWRMRMSERFKRLFLNAVVSAVAAVCAIVALAVMYKQPAWLVWLME